MPVPVIVKDEQYILNHCTKYLARTQADRRHNLGQFADDDPRGRYCEGWRFPVIDGYGGDSATPQPDQFNAVTFVYPALESPRPASVSVVGTFTDLYQPVPLRAVRFLDEETGYFAATVLVPKGEVHTYQYLVDGQPTLDPINPQRVVLDNGRTWSRFFTQNCAVPVTFERWEYVLVDRLTKHILPFRTKSGERFLSLYYQALDKAARQSELRTAYLFDETIGVVNFIDKLLAREEGHHLVDYRICLHEIDRLLRARNPFIEPSQMSMDMYQQLYEEMGRDAVPGWNTSRYGSPRYFLQLLRRHTFTGAFAHPKYGGNAGAAGWAYLAERFLDDQKRTLFDWARNIERPLGTSETYLG